MSQILLCHTLTSQNFFNCVSPPSIFYSYHTRHSSSSRVAQKVGAAQLPLHAASHAYQQLVLVVLKKRLKTEPVAQSWLCTRCGQRACASRWSSWWMWSRSTLERWNTSTCPPASHLGDATVAAAMRTWSASRRLNATSLCRCSKFFF